MPHTEQTLLDAIARAPKTPQEFHIEHALAHLREAAGCLRNYAPKAYEKARKAIASTEGALRHAQNRATRKVIQEYYVGHPGEE